MRFIYIHSITNKNDDIFEEKVRDDSNRQYIVLKEKLFEKLLVHKAEVDSVEVSDQEIDDAIDRRMNYMLMRLGGSEKEFSKFFDLHQKVFYYSFLSLKFFFYLMDLIYISILF